ncbi:MAG TPA: MarR family transcriptional regulator [Conexibacter sp.]|jgi:DNA-binding MarR family transcriptional regulator
MPAQIDPALLASELRVELGRVIRRLRAHHRFPIALAAVLGRIDRDGPRGVSDLAVAERVRPQSMAQTVSDLEAAGLVMRRPDPTDGRRQLVELTTEGFETLRADRRDRESWLAQVIAADFDPAEQQVLETVVELLRRIADADP